MPTTLSEIEFARGDRRELQALADEVNPQDFDPVENANRSASAMAGPPFEIR